MYLLFSNMSACRGILGTFIAGFLWNFMPFFSKGLSGTYMWSSLTDSSWIVGQLRIIPSHRYDLKFDVPGR